METQQLLDGMAIREFSISMAVAFCQIETVNTYTPRDLIAAAKEIEEYIRAG